MVIDFLVGQGLALKPVALDDPRIDGVFAAQQSKISTGSQPKPSKLPPVVPEYSQVAVFYVESSSDVSCALMSKLPQPLDAFTSEGLKATIPKDSRFFAHKCAFLQTLLKGVKLEGLKPAKMEGLLWNPLRRGSSLH